MIFHISQILGFTDPLEIFKFHAKILTRQKQYKLRDTAYVSESVISLTWKSKLMAHSRTTVVR